MLAVTHALRTGFVLRWALAGPGLATFGFGGYLLVHLYDVFALPRHDGVRRQGPGLYLVVGGGLVAFRTILLPMPERGRVADSD